MSIVKKTVFNPLSGNFDTISDPSETMGGITGEPTGFQNPEAWTRTYDPLTRTVTLTPTGNQSIYYRGKEFVKSAPISLQHPDVTGDYFFVIDANGDIQVSTTPFDFTVPQTAFAHWDAALQDGYGIRENHGLTLDGASHKIFHEQTGTYRKSGGVVSGLVEYLISSGTNPTLADINFDVSQAVICDEDLQTTLAAFTQNGVAPYARFYKQFTANKYIWDLTNVDAPYFQTGNVPYYNPSSGGDSLVAMTALSHANWWLVAVPVMTGSDDFRFVVIQPQRQFTASGNNNNARTAALDLALAEDWRTLDLTGLPFSEMIPIQRITCEYRTNYSNNAYRLRVSRSEPIIGTRQSPSTLNTVSPTIHANLLGLSDPAQHPATSITVTPASGIAATDAQGALQEISLETAAAQSTADGAATSISNHIASGTAHNASAIVGFDEAAQDAAAAMATSTPDILQTYNDAAPSLTASWRGRGKNFVTNPDAAVATTGLSATVGTPTIIRNTTNPLCGSADFGIQNAAGAWEVTWTVNALDLALHNRLGELGLVLKGAAIAGGYLRVFSGATKIFEQLASGNLILDENNPKKFGGTFPIGALPATITITLGGSGAITGNSIGGTPTLQAGFAYLGEPVSVSSGAVVTEWQSYTPTTQGFGTLSVSNLQYRRVGSSIEVRGNFTAGTVTADEARVGLPSGLSILSPSPVVAGEWFNNSTSTNVIKSGAFRVVNGNTYVIFTGDEYALTYSPSAARLGTEIAANGMVFYFQFSVPISGWQATDIVTPEQSIVEYAANTGGEGSTANVTYTSSAYNTNDINGCPVPPLTQSVGQNSVTYACYFQQDLRDSDELVLQANTGNGWINVIRGTASIDYRDVSESGVWWGVDIFRVAGNSKRVDVRFALTGSGPQGSTRAYGSTTAGDYRSWAAANGLGYRYRIMKRPGGPGSQSFSIQGPVKAAGTGIAVSSEYCNYTVTSNVVEASGTSNAGVTLGTLPLTKGIWAVSFSGGIINSSGTITSADWSITLTTNSSLNPSGVYSDLANTIGSNGYAAVSNLVRGSDSKVAILNVTADTTYYLRAQFSASGGGSVGVKGYAKAVLLG